MRIAACTDSPVAVSGLVIVAIFSGGWSWTRSDGSGFWRSTQLGIPGGLIGVCTLIAGIMLLVKKTYPRGLFDFILGMNRWVFRVIAYVALMTDQYPPFHFDGGPTEPPDGVSPAPFTPDATAHTSEETHPSDAIDLATNVGENGNRARSMRDREDDLDTPRRVRRPM